MTATVHPIRNELADPKDSELSDEEFADHLAFEWQLRHGCACPDCFPSQDFEARNRSKWDAMATGIVSPHFAFEAGVGVQVTARIVEQSLRESIVDDPEDLTLVLSWLATWVANRRADVEVAP
jgi:hypothetical protein